MDHLWTIMRCTTRVRRIHITYTSRTAHRCWWLSDRLSGSVINAHAPHLYSASLGGMIISASAVRLRCAFSAE